MIAYQDPIFAILSTFVIGRMELQTPINLFYLPVGDPNDDYFSQEKENRRKRKEKLADRQLWKKMCVQNVIEEEEVYKETEYENFYRTNHHLKQEQTKREKNKIYNK